MKKYSTLLTGLLSLMANYAFASHFTFDSTSFSNMATLDAVYTCDGRNITPELEWKNVPAKTESFALILSDPDAPGGTFYHWVLFNIPKNINSLAKGISKLPENSITGKNSWGRMQYNGPCPPSGSTHKYIFHLYALNTLLNLTDEAEAKDVINAIQNHIVGEAEMKTIYGH